MKTYDAELYHNTSKIWQFHNTNKQTTTQWDSWSQKKTPESYFYKESITMQRTQKQKSIQELDKNVTKKDEIMKIQQVN